MKVIAEIVLYDERTNEIFIWPRSSALFFGLITGQKWEDLVFLGEL